MELGLYVTAASGTNADMGMIDGSVNAEYISFGAGPAVSFSMNDGGGSPLSKSTASVLGYWIGTRTASNVRTAYQNGLSFIASDGAASIALPTIAYA